MTTYLTMPSILSSLRRSRERSRSKSTSLTSPSKAKPLDILPGLTELSEQEEDQRIASTSSSLLHLSPSPTRNLPSLQIPPADLSAKKRDSRRVVLTGVEGLTFDDLLPLQTPRPAPSPPSTRSNKAARALDESPLDSIELRFSGLNFPFSGVPSTPGSLRSTRSPSPTPSCASSASASTVSSVASAASACAKVLTPPTSDDECQETLTSRLSRAPTFKSHRGTIGYVPGARKQRSASERSFVDLQVDADEAEDESEDASWFAQHISDSFILSSPESEPSTLPKTSVTPMSRAGGKSRFSKPLPPAPRLSLQSLSSSCPSAQLDPAFPIKRRSYIPNRPPPPPPIRIIDVECDTKVLIAPPTPEQPTKSSPTMEEKTEELLALLANAALANAALTTTSLAVPAGPSRLSCMSNPTTPMSTTPHNYEFVVPTPTVARPLPRFVPADIPELSDPEGDSPVSANFYAADIDELDLGALELEWVPDSDDDESMPPTPRSASPPSIYSQASMPRVLLSQLSLDAIPLEPATPAGSSFFLDDDDAAFYGIPIPDSPSVHPHDDLFFPVQPEKVLRSRWSSSTLAESMVEHRSSGWMGRFAFGGGKRSPTKSSFALKSPTMPHFTVPKPAFGSPAKKDKVSTPSAPGSSAFGSPTKKSAMPSPAKSSRGSPLRTLGRRNSNISLCASDSGESVCSASSTTSNGLKRKPIPVEIFMRA